MAQQPPQSPPCQPTYPQWPSQPPPGQYVPQYQPPAFPPPTPESPEKRRRRILIAVAIIIVGLTVQAIILIRSFGQVRSAAGTADVHVPLAPNSTGTFRQGVGLMKTRVTILSINSTQAAPNAATTKQIAIEVMIENTGRFSISNEPWKLRGSDDREYDPVFLAGVNNLPSRFRLSSGGQIQGTLVFVVPTNVTARSLRYGPHLPLNPNLYFDAP